MPAIKKLAKLGTSIVAKKQSINWHPGHMYSGMKAIIGKLSTVDCVIEVHDARIPFLGRNTKFKQYLGQVKPHVLVLNKMDLADLSRWDEVERKLSERGDENVLLTDLSGSADGFKERGYNKLLDIVVKLINESDRNNRQASKDFKVMFVGIPNVGKSTLINRLRQNHVGLKGEPATTGPTAGVTKNVPTMIKICSRPPIYSLDTPGILKPGTTSNHDRAMKLALCAALNDDVVNFVDLSEYLLKYLNQTENNLYTFHLELPGPVHRLTELVKHCAAKWDMYTSVRDIKTNESFTCPNEELICRTFIKNFRRGLYGKVMFT